MIRVLFSDVDRTLLTHTYELLPAVRDAVGAAKESGIDVILATARPPMAVLPYAEELGVTDLCICLNGAWVGDLRGGDATVLGQVRPDVVDHVVETCAADGIELLYYTANEIFVTRITPTVVTHCSRTGEVPKEVQSVRNIAAPVLKVLCISTLPNTNAVFRGIAESIGNRAVCAMSRADLLEITASDVSKGRAVAEIARQRGLMRSECAAIGDSDNDLSLLTWADVKLTVDNAMPAIKRIAPLHFASCDVGGMAQAIAYLQARNRFEQHCSV
ncbi:Cof-type HAD-IIB family hydrolase [Paraburkholderia sabiae]|uniref:HAD family hydrolase n=1 Tax=Paraburkholderia sabiae TaxID=273251 RepID=A0ABU9QHX0_9BURK|nr:HAD family hydrolase [Paraburkholderia sabiae]WJZ77425.1 HAD family hydrolase [Paraburkholderia sabiae]CAD6557772.1 Sugar phosphatase YidA [Paraburkholderia sabiae]